MLDLAVQRGACGATFKYTPLSGCLVEPEIMQKMSYEACSLFYLCIRFTSRVNR